MNQVIAGMDPLLVPFVEEGDGSESEQLLNELNGKHADPVILKIIKAKLRVSLSQDSGSKENQDGLEIASSLRTVLIPELRELQNNSNQRTIASFPDYVAVKTFSACANYFRERNPQRARLKNLIRRRLKQHSQFALWRSEDKRWYAGLSEWKNVDTQAGDHLESGDLVQVTSSTEELPGSAVDQLLEEIFANARQPLPFDGVVAFAAERWNVKDLPHDVSALAAQNALTNKDITTLDGITPAQFRAVAGFELLDSDRYIPAYGFEANVTRYFSKHVGLSGDFSGYYKRGRNFRIADTLFKADHSIYHFLAGPQAKFLNDHRASVFVHALGGLAHTSVSCP